MTDVYYALVLDEQGDAEPDEPLDDHADHVAAEESPLEHFQRLWLGVQYHGDGRRQDLELGHLHQPAPEAVLREDEEHLLQHDCDVLEFLERGNKKK